MKAAVIGLVVCVQPRFAYTTPIFPFDGTMKNVCGCVINALMESFLVVKDNEEMDGFRSSKT